MFSQTYILYDNARVIKPTFLSELDQCGNIFSQFTIFYKKNNQDIKSFTKNNIRNFFHLENNYTGEKQFSPSLRKLDSTPAKFLSDKISIEFLTRAKKNTRKRKMYDKLSIEDTFLVLRIQDLTQLSTLNPYGY